MIDIEQISEFYPESLRPFRKNILREYLQYKILEIIYESEYFRKLIFIGGTAIRILHGNTRFSEDLDFDNQGISKKDFLKLTELIKKRFELEGYKLETKVIFRQAYKCYFKFLDILSQTGITGHKGAKLIVQLDAEAQNYKYDPKRFLINKFDVFTRVFSVPLDLLLSQKICAVFTRKRSIGRDFFDIVFLHGKAIPDKEYLKQKLNIKDFVQLKNRLLDKCEALDFKQLSKDIAPFIFKPGDSKKILFFKDYVKEKF